MKKFSITQGFLAMAILLLAGHLPALAATNYGIRIGGVEVTSDNYSNISGSASNISGTVKYDPNTCTLTLQNATINANNTNGMHFYGEFYYGLKVKLVGTNTITNVNGIGLGIHITQSTSTNSQTVAFQGTGTLDIPGCINVYTYCPKLRFSETCTVKATYCYSEISNSSIIMENGATLHLTQGNNNGTLRGFSGVTFYDGTTVTLPEGASYDSTNKYLKNSNGTKVTGEAKLGVVDYKITVGGVKVTSWNKNNITGSNITGTVTFNPSYNRLVLSSATINAGGIKNERSGLEILLNGNNTIKGSFPLDINADTRIYTDANSFPFTNTQTLTASNSPIFIGKDSKLTIENIKLSTTGSSSSGAIRGYGSGSKIDFKYATVTVNAGSNPIMQNINACTMTSDEIISPSQVCYRSNKKWIGTTTTAATGTLQIDQPTTEYNILVAGHMLNNLNASNFMYENITSGTITYDYSQNKLSLNNVTATTESGKGAVRIEEGSKDENFTINVEGTNTFGTEGYIFHNYSRAPNTLTINGTGTLDAKYVSLSGTLRIKDCSLNAEYLRCWNGDITYCYLTDATVNLSGNSSYGAISGFNNLYLQGVDFLSPEKLMYSSPDKYLYLPSTGGVLYSGAVSIGVKDYGLIIAGTRVTSANASEISGTGISGSVIYDPSFNRLTLNNASISTSSYIGINNKTGGELKITLKGNNTVKGTHAISSDNDLTINGDLSANTAALDINGSITAILMNGAYTLSLSFADITAQGATSSGCLRGDNNSKLSLFFVNVTVNAGSYPCVKGFSEVDSWAAEVTSPKKVWFNPSLKGYGNASSLTTGTLVIERPSQLYGVSVAGHEMNDLNKDNFYYDNISGTVSYDSDTNTLTLDNVTADCQDDNGLYCNQETDEVNLTVLLKGTNDMTNSSGIKINNNTCTFTGNNASLITDGTLYLNHHWGWDDYIIDGVTLEGTNFCFEKSGTIYPCIWMKNGAKLRLTGANDLYPTIQGLVLHLDDNTTYGGKVFHFTTPNGAWIDYSDGTLKTSPYAGNEVVNGEVVLEQVNDYQIKVANVSVTSANKSDVLAGMGISGKATYNTGTKELTLSGINLPVPAEPNFGYAIETGTMPSNFSVLVKNTNNFTNSGLEAVFGSNTTVNSSNGILKVKGIYSNNAESPANLTLNNLTLRGEYLWGNSGTCTINACDIVLTGNGSGTLQGFSTLTGPGLLITTPEGAVYNNNCLMKNGQMVTGKVVIGFEQGPPTAIDGIEEGLPQVETVYDTAGRQLNDTRKGMNLVRMSDGTVRKQVRRK